MSSNSELIFTAMRLISPEGGRHPATPSAVEAADRMARHWTSIEVGPFAPGSAAHKRAICAMFQETFNPYRPSVIAWPVLKPEELRRLKSLPIWDIAVQTEGRARLSFAAYADSLDDPEMRSAIMLNAWEENRHKEVLSHLVRAYGIELAVEPPYLVPRDREFAFLVTGYSESIDSFFAFGLFELARRSGFFPAELVETFEPVIQEECRHILLFANWLAWNRATSTGGGASGSSCASPRPGSTSPACALVSPGAWAPTVRQRSTKTTSRSTARRP